VTVRHNPAGEAGTDPENTGQSSSGLWNDDMERLHRQAVERFGARCLWNMRPSKTLDGMRVVADGLRAHGGMDAWRLATEIREAIARAAR